MVGIWSRRALVWLIGLVAFALLPFAPASADPPVFDGKEIKDLCTITASGMECPVFPPPPPLLNPGAVAAAGSEVGASLERLQDQAVENTLADHGLPESDREAVLGWARDDADAELWALIVEAITPQRPSAPPTRRTRWRGCGKLASAQADSAAEHAGEEYATWAGLDVTAYRRMADTASQAQLTTFLSEDVRPFSPLFTPNGGYCRYTPPDPFSADYDGSETQTCFVPCSFLACVIPTPKYDDFVKWGQAAVSNGTLSDATLQAQQAQIAEASMYAMVGTAAALVLGTALGTILSSRRCRRPSSRHDHGGEVATATGGAAIGTTAGVAAIAGAVLIVLLAIVTSVLEGIRVADNAALPGQIAQYVVNARTAVTDPATLIGTTAAPPRCSPCSSGPRCPGRATTSRATTHSSRRGPTPGASIRTSWSTCRWARTRRSSRRRTGRAA